MADKTFAVSHVLSPFTGGKIDLVYIHGIRVRVSGSVSQRDIAVSPSSELPKLYHIPVTLSCLVEPLFPFPTSFFLTVREGGGGHHDGELLGYSSLEGIHKDAVVIDSTVHLGQLEGCGVFIEISIKLVHAEGIDGLACLVLDIFWNEGFLKGLA